MDKNLFNKLERATIKEGPFMDYGVDKVLCPELLEWINGDWQKLRVLLNYVSERGGLAVMSTIRANLDEYEDLLQCREASIWKKELQNNLTGF